MNDDYYPYLICDINSGFSLTLYINLMQSCIDCFHKYIYSNISA